MKVLGFIPARGGSKAVPRKNIRLLLGKPLLQYTAELQARLFKDFKFAVFSDNGSLSNGLSDLGRDSFRHSAGLGLRYTTPVGPVRLDYGIKLDRKPGEGFGKLFFSIGQAF